MKFKPLGNTELQVSLICLGTMTWGEQNTENEAFEQMDYSLEKGVNFFDTAEYYSVKGKEKTYGPTPKLMLRENSTTGVITTNYDYEYD